MLELGNEGARDDLSGPEGFRTLATTSQVGKEVVARVCDMPAGACTNECLRRAMGEGACDGREDGAHPAFQVAETIALTTRALPDAAEELVGSGAT